LTTSPHTACIHHYELTNHLGNVSVIVSDKKLLSANQSQKLYLPEVISYQDYYPFGMFMTDRSGSLPDVEYRYGYNGKENDNEVKGESNQQDYGFRVYDPRVGRFLSVDPLTKDYPMLTPYQFASNRPIDGIDLDGLEWTMKINNENGKTELKVNVTFAKFDGLSSEIENEILLETNKQFNEMVNLASKGNTSISLTFNQEPSGNQNYIPRINILDTGEEIFSGLSLGDSGVGVGFCNSKGEQKSIGNLANTIVHELLHQLRIETWELQTEDTEMKIFWHEGKRRFNTTTNTHPSIYNNILMYNYHLIDGKTAIERFGTGDVMTTITPQQLKLMFQEIGMQMKGYGALYYDQNSSPDEDKVRIEKYSEYWGTIPKLKNE
jgi:RHS repeat-associated protein